MLYNSVTYNSSARPVPKKIQGGTIRIAAIQMAAGPNVSGNLEEAARLLDMAASQGAKLAALPEYFCIMGMKDVDKVAAREQDNRGPIQEFLSRTAKRLGIWRVGGTVQLVASKPDKVRNSCLGYYDEGKQFAPYDERHQLCMGPGKGGYAEEVASEAVRRGGCA